MFVTSQAAHGSGLGEGGRANLKGVCLYTYRGVCRSEYLEDDDDIVKKRKRGFLAHHPTTMVGCLYMKVMGLGLGLKTTGA